MTVALRTLLLSIRNIFANKKQNLLAISTVILGSLTISTVFTVNANVDRYIDHLISKNGGANLFVKLTNHEHYFDFKDFDSIRSIASTSYIVLDESLSVSLKYKKNAMSSQAILFETDYPKARPVKIIEGQRFGPLENFQARNNVILNPAVIKQLDIKEPIGKSITVNSWDDRQLVLKIVGVAEAQFDSNGRPTIWLPKTSFSYLVDTDKFSSLILGTNSYSNLDNYEEMVREQLETQFNYELNFYNPRLYFEKLRSEYETFIKAGAIIGLLALLGGTLGVLNLMLMSIKLRLKEIGLYRALGFPTSVVLLIFVMESLITLNIGGVIGSALGCISGYFISERIVTMPPLLTPQAFLYGFAATFIIGMLFAYFPARKAAKLETVEALRS